MTWDAARYHRRQAEAAAGRVEVEDAWAVCTHCKTPYLRSDLRRVTGDRMVCTWHYFRGMR